MTPNGNNNEDIEEQLMNAMSPSTESQMDEVKSKPRIDPMKVMNHDDTVQLGWRDVEILESPSNGKYLPYGTSVQMKSARTPEIKYYSTMDNNMSSIEKHVDSIMNNNIRIMFNDGTRGTLNDISYFDRIHYLFLLREMTMLNYSSDKKLTYSVTNPTNQSQTKLIDIDYTTFDYYKIRHGISKWYSEKLRCFNIVDGEINLRFYIPTVGVIKSIKEYVTGKEIKKQRGEEGHEYDEYFCKALQYLCSDWRKLDSDDYINDMQKFYNNLSQDEHELVTSFVREIEIGIKPTILVDFGGGDKARVPIRFRDFSSIFSISNRSADLLSDTK